RRARLREMPLGAFLADDLTDLAALEAPDEPRVEPEGQPERRQRRGDGAERHVAEDVQKAEPGLVVERIEEVVDHASSSPSDAALASSGEPTEGSSSASTTLSILIPREPLTSTTSAAPTISSTQAAASSTFRRS